MNATYVGGVVETMLRIRACNTMGNKYFHVQLVKFQPVPVADLNKVLNTLALQ